MTCQRFHLCKFGMLCQSEWFYYGCGTLGPWARYPRTLIEALLRARSPQVFPPLSTIGLRPLLRLRVSRDHRFFIVV